MAIHESLPQSHVVLTVFVQCEMMSTFKTSFQDLETIYNNAWQARHFTNSPGIQQAAMLCEKPLEELCQMSSNQWKKKLQNDLLKKLDDSGDIVSSLLSEGIGTCTKFTLCCPTSSNAWLYARGHRSPSGRVDERWDSD